jgi:hypothetical protein
MGAPGGEALVSQHLLSWAIEAQPTSETTTGRLTDYARLVSAPIRLSRGTEDVDARAAKNVLKACSSKGLLQ